MLIYDIVPPKLKDTPRLWRGSLSAAKKKKSFEDFFLGSFYWSYF